MHRRQLFGLLGAALALTTAGVATAAPGRPTNPGSQRTVVVAGIVKSVDGTSFVVERRGGRGSGRNGNTQLVTVTTTDTTQYRKSDGSAAGLSDVAVGIRVQVQGKQGEGSITASRVLIVVRNSGG